MNRKRGFTLIELLATVAILSILVGISIPLLRNSVRREKEVQLRQALRDMRSAIDKYKLASDEGRIEVPVDTDGYPQTLDILVEGVQLIGQAGKNIKFLRKIPVDPMTNSSDWGLRSYQDEPAAPTWGGQNVFDVYTRSNGVALDGSLYKDW